MIKERSSNFLDTRYINLCYDRLWSCKSKEKKMSEKLTGMVHEQFDFRKIPNKVRV